MKTLNRICIEDYEVSKGSLKAEAKRGKEYLTSEEDEDGMVTVFSSLWFKAPARIFAGEKVFTSE